MYNLGKSVVPRNQTHTHTHTHTHNLHNEITNHIPLHVGILEPVFSLPSMSCHDVLPHALGLTVVTGVIRRDVLVTLYLHGNLVSQ